MLPTSLGRLLSEVRAPMRLNPLTWTHVGALQCGPGSELWGRRSGGTIPNTTSEILSDRQTGHRPGDVKRLLLLNSKPQARHSAGLMTMERPLPTDLCTWGRCSYTSLSRIPRRRERSPAVNSDCSRLSRILILRVLLRSPKDADMFLTSNRGRAPVLSALAQTSPVLVLTTPNLFGDDTPSRAPFATFFPDSCKPGRDSWPRGH
jgi:hypothetical protein